MISEYGLQRMGTFIQNLVVKGRIKIDGEFKDTNIYRSAIEGDTIKFYLLLDNTFSGNIESKQLVDTNGQVIFENAYMVKKDTSKGLLIIFSIKISEVSM